ncbi:MAG: DNA polymerase Y family protein [Gammaproteobacteria bacterium]|nr:MAG: DNA polymerase Y family protein [Gammaproteobacteria bacterium]
MATQWLCIRIPQLALEVFSRSGSEEQPLAVCDDGRPASILFCNPPARRRGICSGMPVAAARALAHDLSVCSRDRQAEADALHGLAAWAYQFSSQVSLYPPFALLLEVRRSLSLFGGYTALLERIRAGLGELGYQTRLAAAPTPLAAVSLACCASEQHVETRSALAAALAPLPLSVLDWEQGLLDRLHGVGVQRLGDLLRLPRDGLARRLGPDSVLYLDRLLGRQPDPRALYQPPPRFERSLQLPAEVGQAGALLFALQRLILELCGWLQGQGAAVQELEVRLWHREQAITRLSIGVQRKSRAAEQFLILLRERLQRLELQQPVIEVGLYAERLLPLDGQSLQLFGAARQACQVDLLDRLRARLGSEAVRGLSAVAEHRPEYAWRYSEPGQGEQAVNGQQRPLWLLPVPRQLKTDHGWPCLQGRLKLQHSRERIESGWWDGQDIARDYFIAESASGSRYWIYRELDGQRRWFLQGLFE